MTMNRRRLFAALAGVSVSPAMPALAREAPRDDTMPRAEIDALSLGVRANADTDQSEALQRAIERAATAGAALRLPPGIYRAGGLKLPSYTAIVGVPGTTQLVMTGGPSLLLSTGSDHISLRNLLLDGGNLPLDNGRGLIHLTQGRRVRITGCEIFNAGRNAITLEAIEGEISSNAINNVADYAIFSNDAAGLRISGNTARGAGNGGILVWRNKPGDDGTLVIDNRIENISNKRGGTGQWGNAINAFRADNVIVRGNRIHNAAYSAIRGNSASNLQIAGNTCSRIGETALYVEFAFEGAVVANNIVDGAAVGVSVTNFDKGGRLAVVQGNLIRNLVATRPAGEDQSDTAALGISVEADAAVSGNVVENVPGTGISAGYGPYLRDLAINNNVVRNTEYGIAVSVVGGAGTAIISDNVISGARHAAIVGREWGKTVTGDLSKEDAARYAQLSISGNQVH